jgi:hypothetical protein
MRGWKGDDSDGWAPVGEGTFMWLAFLIYCPVSWLMFSGLKSSFLQRAVSLGCYAMQSVCLMSYAICHEDIWGESSS